MRNNNQPLEPPSDAVPLNPAIRPKTRGTPRQLGGDVLRVLGAWVRGQMAVCLIVSALYALGFALLHVPWWPFFALLCGFLHLIPSFGAPLGMALTLFVVWAAGADWTHILMVAGVFVLVMTFEGYFLTPRIMGRRLGVSPLLVFFGTLVGGLVFGFPGLLLAVPVLAVLNVVWRHFRRSQSF